MRLIPIESVHVLITLIRCVILPHIGSATNETRRDMAILSVKNLLAGVKGEPLPASLKV